MMETENERVARRFYEEVVNQGSLDLLQELVAEDFTEQFATPGQPAGRAGLEQFLRMVGTAFPDAHATIEDIIASGDKVAVRLTLRGTHQGPFFGIEATGKSVSWHAIHILRVSSGTIVERWAVADVAGIMLQIGAIPQSIPD